MSLKDRISEIAREESRKTVAAFISKVVQQKECTTMGVITATEEGTNKATVKMTDGSVTTAILTGNKSIGVGNVVLLVGNIII